MKMRTVSVGALLIAVLAGSVAAQEPTGPSPGPAPANLAYVEGAVDVLLDNVVERADPPMSLFDGASVRTLDGRAEIVLADGSLLHLGPFTDIEILDQQRWRLRQGRAAVRAGRDANYRIDTPAAAIRVNEGGEYLFLVDRDRLELAVVRGTALVEGDVPWSVSGGHQLTLAHATARPLIERFNSARLDAFGDWSSARAGLLAASYSARQLPQELRPYGSVFDGYGRWDYVAPHGYVWFPSVGLGWRPYYDGAWHHTRSGWAWRGRDRWSWATHHYGRWGLQGDAWFWIPVSGWAPAWVSWSVSPAYVSWAPLGWDNRPAIGFAGRPDHPAYWPDYRPWRAWTVMSRDRFQPRRDVRGAAIDGALLDDRSRRLVVDGLRPLPPLGNAIPRSRFDEPTPRGDVRRLPRAYEAGGGVANDNGTTRPGSRASDPYRTGRPGDDPAYAPPRNWAGGDGSRQGDVRSPGSPRQDRGDGDTGGNRDGAVSRGTPNGDGGKAAGGSKSAAGERSSAPRGPRSAVNDAGPAQPAGAARRPK